MQQKSSLKTEIERFFCTLNDTLTAKMMMFRRQHPK